MWSHFQKVWTFLTDDFEAEISKEEIVIQGLDFIFGPWNIVSVKALKRIEEYAGGQMNWGIKCLCSANKNEYCIFSGIMGLLSSSVLKEVKTLTFKVLYTSIITEFLQRCRFDGQEYVLLHIDFNEILWLMGEEQPIP